MKIVKKILATTGVVIILIILLTAGNVLFFWDIFGWVKNVIGDTTGWNESITKGLAALVLACLIILPTGKMFLSATPIPFKYKAAYRVSIFLLIAGFYCFVYFTSKDVYFDPRTGLAKQYYSERPDGTYYTNSKPGFDPITGDRLKPVTKQVALKMKGLLPPPKAPEPVYTPPVVVTAPTPVIQYIAPAEPVKEVIKEDAKPVRHQNQYVKNSEPIETPRSVDQALVNAVTNEPIETRANYETPRVRNAQLAAMKCLMFFENQTENGFSVFNSSKDYLFHIDFRNKSQNEMDPGSYYYKMDGSIDYGSFKVPNSKTHGFVLHSSIVQQQQVREPVQTSRPAQTYQDPTLPGPDGRVPAMMNGSNSGYTSPYRRSNTMNPYTTYNPRRY